MQEHLWQIMSPTVWIVTNFDCPIQISKLLGINLDIISKNCIFIKPFSVVIESWTLQEEEGHSNWISTTSELV